MPQHFIVYMQHNEHICLVLLPNRTVMSLPTNWHSMLHLRSVQRRCFTSCVHQVHHHYQLTVAPGLYTATLCGHA